MKTPQAVAALDVPLPAQSALPAAPGGNVAPPPGVGARARTGFSWLMLQTAVTKVFNTCATFAVAWFLLPEDYKLAALAFPITMFASTFQQLGVDKVLIARRGEFGRWANAGFWMSVTAGVVSGLAIVAAAPVAAIVYHHQALLSILMILAIAAPLNAVVTVHQAKLQCELRFKLLASAGIAGSLVQAGLMVWMAWRGYGVMSLIVPIVAGAGIRTALLGGAVSLPIRWALEVASWRHLVKDSTLVMGTQIMFLIAAQGDFLLLGLVLPSASETLGYFSFAFTLSISVITPLVMNLTAVLFPALSALAGDPARQVSAMLAASRRIAVLGVPLCLLQAALARPVLTAMYGQRWGPAIPAIQILSVCMAIRVVCISNGALFTAQKRFAFYFKLSAIYATVFLGAVFLGALIQSITAISLAETIFFVIFDNLYLYLAIRPGGGNIGDIANLYKGPMLAGLGSLAAAECVALAIPAVAHADILRAGAITTVMLFLYVTLISQLDRASYADLRSYLGRLMVRGSRVGRQPHRSEGTV